MENVNHIKGKLCKYLFNNTKYFNKYMLWSAADWFPSDIHLNLYLKDLYSR